MNAGIIKITRTKYIPIISKTGDSSDISFHCRTLGSEKYRNVQAGIKIMITNI